MSDRVPTGRTVHWLGAGLSTGRGLGILCDEAARGARHQDGQVQRVVVWHRTAERAAERLATLGLTGRADTRAFTTAALAAELAPGDVVVSMLPAAHHPELLRLCVEHRAHFACSSYASPELAAQSAAVTVAGVSALTEAGLDPGIDHLFAHQLVHDARAKLGDGPATVDFVSHCGGLPAEPNDFRYRFSWAPRGVLNALRTPSRYLDGGQVRTAERPWEATTEYAVGGETFEVYPNRDSTPFIAQYRLPQSWRPETFVRGTLRLAGWRQAWAPVFTALREDSQEQIDALADDLAARYPSTAQDHDRVVLSVALNVRTDEGATWSGDYRLDLVGDDQESAMARCVSVPLAFGVLEILAGRTRPGLRRAAEEPDEVARWLAFLSHHDLAGARDSTPDGRP